MPQIEPIQQRKWRLALSFRISLILILVAVIPLIVTMAISEYAARNTLINQANQTLQTDAQTRVQLINNYLSERLLDTRALSQSLTAQEFLTLTPQEQASNAGDLQSLTLSLLGTGEMRDKYYITWQLFSSQNTLAVMYPTTMQPYHYGQYLVPPEEWQLVEKDKTGQPFLSPVYYDAARHQEFVDIYAPIYVNGKPANPFLGFMRATLGMQEIQGIVQGDQGFNKDGSAFILDQNGIYIMASGQSRDLFTAISPLSAMVQRQIVGENEFSQGGDVPIHANNELANSFQQEQLPSHFTFIPDGQTQNYEAVPLKIVVPDWTYFVISPNNTVTDLFNQQLLTSGLATALAALIAVGIGFLIANRITRPILRSVNQLRENSEALNLLANKQQNASSEQLWVIESIQVGLKSIEYYTDATRAASQRMGSIGRDLEYNWEAQNVETVRSGLQHIIKAASYIEEATNYQSSIGQKLASAIQMTTQVNEQLTEGAISATEAASHLEQVVKNLYNIVNQLTIVQKEEGHARQARPSLLQQFPGHDRETNHL